MRQCGDNPVCQHLTNQINHPVDTKDTPAIGVVQLCLQPAFDNGIAARDGKTGQDPDCHLENGIRQQGVGHNRNNGDDSHYRKGTRMTAASHDLRAEQESQQEDKEMS